MFQFQGRYLTLKTQEGVLCSAKEHGTMSCSFQTATQKNEAKPISSCAVRKRNGGKPCFITKQSTASYVLTVLEHGHIQNYIIACTAF